MDISEKRYLLEAYCDKRTNCTGCALVAPDKWSICAGCGALWIDKAPEEELDEAIRLIAQPVEAVDHPSHYNSGKIEVIDFIEDQKLGFCLGNAVKYIARAGKKDPSTEVEDLKKAAWYVARRIKEIEEGLV